MACLNVSFYTGRNSIWLRLTTSNEEHPSLGAMVACVFDCALVDLNLLSYWYAASMIAHLWSRAAASVGILSLGLE